MKIKHTVEIALDPECVKRKQEKKKEEKLDNKNNNNNNSIPETYYIVTNNKYIKQRGLVVWTKSAKSEKHETKMGFWFVLIYIVIILAIVLYQMDFNKINRQFRKLRLKWGRW